MKKILFVDDEKHILKALRRLFFNSEYNCFYVTSGSDALNILKEYDIDLLVTDIRMPKMDGFELLKIVKNKYPDITRVALSGYSDNDAIIKALETNLVKLYLYKPWENEELREVIKKSFALSEILNSEELFRFINNIENI
ncbi:MAG: response regulator, partial [Bacillota bacterium]|nr:response regulator [Bacillota bacterium]